MIQIIFERGEEPYSFRDALYLPEDHTFTDAEIEQMKDDRYTAWYEMVTTPPVVEPHIVIPEMPSTEPDIPLINPDEYVDIDGVRYYKPAES